MDAAACATRSGLAVALHPVRGPPDTTKIRVGLQPWQKASHPGLVPLYGVREDADGLALVCAAGARAPLAEAPPKTAAEAYRLVSRPVILFLWLTRADALAGEGAAVSAPAAPRARARRRAARASCAR